MTDMGSELDYAEIRARAERAVAADDGIAPDLYELLPPELVLVLLDERERMVSELSQAKGSQEVARDEA